MSRRLDTYLDGRFAGHFEQSSHGAIWFIYDEEYAKAPDATPLSLSMPLTTQRHPAKAATAYLEGLLPDSPDARERWAREYNVSPHNPFSLLTYVGRDAAGAVQLLPPGEQSTDALSRHGDIEWLSTEDVAQMSRDLAENGSEWNPGRYGGRWSLAGAQPKMALFRDPDTGSWGIPRDSTPTTHIIKPAIEGFEKHHINEALCMNAARNAGMPAARTTLVDVGDVQAVISERYDRRLASRGWIRLHQEDLCQSLAVHPSMKYQSDGGPGVANVGRLFSSLALPDRQPSARRFLEALVFNVSIGGTDAHAKNYSMMLAGGRAQLAPLYDIASAAPYDQHERLDSAMKIGDHWKMLDITARDWAKVGRHLGYSASATEAVVERLKARLPSAFAAAVDALPPEVRDEGAAMADRIVAHCERRWRPNLTRNPRRLTSSQGPGTSRAKTTPASNRGSFAPRARAEAQVSLDDHS